ncbi:putative toxin-antitoxin system toxin component, PIN family [Geoalkalibacter subterraneus]|uniref:Twitching motility protein PilT n=1 Tax=Geoalkalibacter subterraneus TaxID=483547 RepID=A0A0B5FN95_9BACT|nr:putative toxin-antitoxin system toxin component, PIN family [Geoalkalibacter subterraneus]AJF06049.1 twitching motility protein PilT [Geoalkalibacter subterraneus]
MISVVIDTNVVVAGLLTAGNQSPPARILDSMLSGRFIYLLSPDLLAEYRLVLLRPAIISRHGLSIEEVDDLLEDLAAGAVWREPDKEAKAPDPGDNHLWALLACHPNATLVTGDRLLLENPPPGTKILTPREFLEKTFSAS